MTPFMVRLRAGKRWARRHAGFVGSVTAVRTAQPRIVLTYDDGPEPGGTDQVLAALAERGATATFFVLLTRVRRYPGLLAEVAAAGHEIALHGLDHRRLTDFSFAEARRRIRDGKAELEDAAGRRVTWIRPPYGRQTLVTWHAITSSGLESVMWGPTTLDSINVPDPERLARALRGATAGSIVLAHDGHAGPMDGVDDGPAPLLDRRELTTRVLDGYAHLGLRACSLQEALRDGTAVKEARFRR
jgi:peptidoglycan/xylan/chitin deacetylase (PgdA/CDA1 family)